MSPKRAIRQYLSITLVQTITLLLVSLWMDGPHIRWRKIAQKSSR